MRTYTQTHAVENDLEYLRRPLRRLLKYEQLFLLSNLISSSGGKLILALLSDAIISEVQRIENVVRLLSNEEALGALAVFDRMMDHIGFTPTLRPPFRSRYIQVALANLSNKIFKLQVILIYKSRIKKTGVTSVIDVEQKWSRLKPASNKATLYSRINRKS